MSTLFESKVTPGIFISQIFQSRDIIHISHLQTKIFAEHKALNEYYEGILDLADKLTEAYFGKYGRCEISIPSSKYINPEAHLKQLTGYIESNRTIFKDSYIQNIIDEILHLGYKTLYLLTLS